ncbi:MAG TPA: glycosyltransferase family 4 protein, partial [Thermoanaerobaculia bacterium]|nr:glycosyltransferase family 4 protein [Thermoanaerobaculia bacterium]
KIEQTILLGPYIDLHPGYHESLRNDAPEGVFFYSRGARHYFGSNGGPAPETAFFPFEHPHQGEVIDFGPGPQVAHSARWPVVRRRAWVADLDDFGYPFVLGRYLLNPKAGMRASSDWSDVERAVAARRMANMLHAFAHPSCKAVLFWTRKALEDAARWIRDFGLTSAGEAFLAKSQVVYPAQRALIASVVRQKWLQVPELRVLFVGGDYEAKNGRVALQVFRRLAEARPDVRFTYVGEVPESDRELTEGIDFRGRVPRAEVLSLLKESHVLFHPAREESFGMILLEAAAHGLAVVVARGRGMDHIDEILSGEEAVLFDRNAASGPEEEGFLPLLSSLLSDVDLARSKALAAYEKAAGGSLSLEARNSALQSIYRQALEDPAPEALSLTDLPHWSDSGHLALSSEEVSTSLRTYLEREKVERTNFYFRG